jgi:cobalt/nickel transport system permease protein
VPIHLAEPYHAGTSPWHRANAKAKLLIVVAFILTLSLLPAGSWDGLALAAGLLWIAIFSAGLRAGWLFKRSLWALPFLLAALPLPFTTPGQPLFADWPISYEGTLRLLTILMRSWLSVQAALLLVATTPFYEILWGLHGLRVPRLLVSVVALMYRYLFVLADEAGRLLRARSARAALLPGRRPPGLLWQARVAGNMVGVLFVRAIERSERVYAAMLARGYQGELRIAEPPAWLPADTRLLLLAATSLALILLVGKAL